MRSFSSAPTPTFDCYFGLGHERYENLTPRPLLFFFVLCRDGGRNPPRLSARTTIECGGSSVMEHSLFPLLLRDSKFPLLGIFNQP
ncbi:hypothetical protein Lal_00030424 [Lupinus albus]|nr:hypothetical protein Lal_00030424 [Lupinus albus]